MLSALLNSHHLRLRTYVRKVASLLIAYEFSRITSDLKKIVLSFLNWLSETSAKTGTGQGFLVEGRKKEELFLINSDQ